MNGASETTQVRVSQPDAVPALEVTRPKPVAGSSLFRNVLANWVGQFVILICGFILPRLANDHLGQTHLGIWDFGWSMVAYLSLLSVGVSSSVNRYIARWRAVEDWQELNRTASSCAFFLTTAGGLAAILTVVMVVLLPSLPSRSFGGDLGETQRMLMLLGMASAAGLCFAVYNGVITGYERYDLVVKIEVICNIVRLAAIAGALMIGWGLTAMAGAVFIVALLEGAFKFVAAHRVCPPLRMSMRSITRQSLRDVVIFGGKTFLGTVARITLYQGNNLLIGFFLGPAALAVFARALALVNRADQMVFQFARVLAPMASSADARNDSKSLANVVLVGSRYSMLIALPFVLMLVILGPALMRVWMGPQFAALPLLPILAAGHLAAMSQWGPLVILLGMNRHGTPALADLAASALSIALSGILLGVFHAGLMGVALSIGICLTFTTLLVTPLLLSKAVGMSLLAYYGSMVSSCWLVIPFGLWVGLSRVILADNDILQLLCGAGGGVLILMLSYWKTLMPESVKSRILAAARLGKRS